MCRNRPLSSSRRPRGVVILIVLSMLVLFSLIGITYAVLAGNYLRAARAAARFQQTDDSPTLLCDLAVYQALVESSSRNSALRGHSLLRDLYGIDYVAGQAGDITTATLVGEQFIRLRLGNAGGLNALPGYYNGCVFTMQTGPAAGYSTRIVAYTPVTVVNGDGSGLRRVATAADVTIEIPVTDDATLPSRIKAGGTLLSGVFVGKTFIINGRANNGSGFGWNTGAQNLTANSPLIGQPLALLPNYAQISAPGASGSDALPTSAGDADEGFDVPDYRDMWLSYILSGASASNQIIPSFHRPELVNFWRANGPSADLPLLLTRSCLRPLPFKDMNPYFSGSNPYLDPANFGAPLGVNKATSAEVTALANRLAGVASGGGADSACMWDVDNDRDGVYDSVWLDLGLPPRRAQNGRMYKPLFAFLIRDLDGRLNVNANGNPLQFTGDYTDSAIPRGHGWGPAEIRLDPVLGSTDAQTIMTGRNGSDSAPGVSGTATSSGADALFTSTMQQGMIGVYGAALSGFGAPPDVWGRGYVSLDASGQPFYYKMGRTNGSYDETSNEPYELNLLRPWSFDSPYTAREMEQLLRTRDADSSAQGSRLASLTSLQNAANVAAVTTHSFDTSEPSVQTPNFLRSQLQDTAGGKLFGPNSVFSPNVSDLMAARLIGGGVGVNATEVPLTHMLGLELVRGQRFNLNRPWGNGLDDDGNGIVDDPIEMTRAYNGADDAALYGQTANASADDDTEKEWAFGSTVSGLKADYKNDYPGPLPPSGYQGAVVDRGRLIYARQLYCLAMMSIHPSYVFPTSEAGLNATQQQELTATRIAQWAVNCVDFRDPDSIMTPFEFDVNPWNGWQVDGNLATTGLAASQEVLPTGNVTTTDRRVVWGMEQPDLLLRESLAWHDRRVKDTNTDDGAAANGTKLRKTATAIGDSDLDQFRVPQGSLFFEMYCPRPSYTSNPAVPAELYTVSGTDAKLDLARLAPAGGTGAYNVAPYNAAPYNVTYPVWRVAVSSRNAVAADNSALAVSLSKPDSFYTATDETGANTNIKLSRLDTTKNVDIDRIVWFANLAPTTQREASKVYYSRMANAKAMVPTGGYAVVGPRAVTRVGSTTSAAPSPQQIQIASNSVTIADRAGVNPNAGVSYSAPVGLVCAATAPGAWTDTATATLGTDAADGATLGRGVGINISEPAPASYYPQPDSTVTNYTEKDGYTIPKDQPFDNPHTAGTSNVVSTPLDAAALLSETGTVQDYRTAFLQRLANPRAPFHPTFNPYLTVDWMPIDITVFNGQDAEPSGWDENSPVGIGEWDPEDPRPINQGSIKFATRQRNGADPFAGASASNLWTAFTTDPPTSTAAVGGEADYFPYDLNQTLGYLNAGFGAPQGGANLGSPAVAFPWLTWNNRPFLNSFEIMDVPSSAPERLGLEHSIAPAMTTVYTSDRHPYGHLLNFFDSGPNAGDASNLHRLLDFVTVPSPFVETVKYYNPNAGQGSSLVGGLLPPFNYFSRYRDPGKVNLNTISDARVLTAITGLADNALAGATPPVPSIFAKFNLSRRGFNDPFMDDAFPSRFARAFRSSCGGDLAPLTNMQLSGIEATLLRSDPNDATVPLFADNSSTDAARGSLRNPHFRYERLTRLSGLTTTRSNVFALWVTVGFFEWDPSINAPQGALGIELNSDIGDVKRYRAFCIIDRSIPVAFKEGQYNNVDRCILVRKYLD